MGRGCGGGLLFQLFPECSFCFSVVGLLLVGLFKAEHLFGALWDHLLLYIFHIHIGKEEQQFYLGAWHLRDFCTDLVDCGLLFVQGYCFNKDKIWKNKTDTL